MEDERISILDVEEMDEDFHARFSATNRHYLYRIVNRHQPIPLERERAWWVKRPLDIAVMQDAAQLLIGTHDFTTFRAAQCQSRSPVKTLDRVEFSRSGELVEVRVSAKSFLHNQVRSIVGTLKLVGEGRLDERGRQGRAGGARSSALRRPRAARTAFIWQRSDYDVVFTPVDTTPAAA